MKTFAQKKTIRFYDLPVKLGGAGIFAADVTSWDLRVFDLDRSDGLVDTAVYELLGQDPQGTNTTEGSPVYFSSTKRTNEGWSGPDSGYSFLYDLDTTFFDPEGGHRYEFEFTYSTFLNGTIQRRTTLRCDGRSGVA